MGALSARVQLDILYGVYTNRIETQQLPLNLKTVSHHLQTKSSKGELC